MTPSSFQTVQDIFIKEGVNETLFKNQTLRVHSLLYMIYWQDRLKNNRDEQKHIEQHLNAYLALTPLDFNILRASPDYPTLIDLSHQYVKEHIQAVQTVDLVIEREKETGHKKSREVLLFERPQFPKGISLPGGLVNEEDEHNILNIEAKIFAALRIAAEKVLYLKEDERVYKSHTQDNSTYYSVENKTGTQKIILHPKDIYGYTIKENLNAVLRPSDPRHLVDTIGFKCEIVDESPKNKEYFWESKSNLLNHTQNKTFAFHHHKEIILHTLGKTSVESELHFNEHQFIQKIINNPLDSYGSFFQRFKENHFNTNTSFPELFPTVHRVLETLFSEEINGLCQDHKMLIGFRDKAVNALRHVSLKNREFCPYLPTLHALFDSVAFFDVVARFKKDFYNTTPSNQIIEHNPKEQKNAAYHMYKYEYRKNELLGKVPNEIIIPTFVPMSATDLMKVRGVPIRLVGLSSDFIYVDEFEQSPEEFLMHDLNHSYRMMAADEQYLKLNKVSPKDFRIRQNQFMHSYLSSIKILPTDSEQEKEFKKIKKIILFEILHEDARPFLPDVILNCLLCKEGGETPFEVPVIDEKTHYLDIVDTLDTHIHVLSYVRNKLQCGFYDKVDKQNIQIVHPQYRKSHFIAKAAMEMIQELYILLNQNVEVDFEYILKRVCSAGPDNIHEAFDKDDNMEKYGDGVRALNLKRYHSNLKV